MRRKLHSYVHGTQQGFASGLCNGETRFDESYHHSNGTTDSIDTAYRAASLRASGRLATAKSTHKRLIDWTPIPVACCGD